MNELDAMKAAHENERSSQDFAERYIAALEVEIERLRKADEAGRNLFFATHMVYMRMGQPGKFRMFLTGSYLGTGIDPMTAVNFWDQAYQRASEIFGDVLEPQERETDAHE